MYCFFVFLKEALQVPEFDLVSDLVSDSYSPCTAGLGAREEQEAQVAMSSWADNKHVHRRRKEKSIA